jgi:hypothetical protein
MATMVVVLASLAVTVGGIAVSLVTSDRWPGWLQPYRRWGWWAVLGLGLAAAGLAVWQARRQASATTNSGTAAGSGAVGGRDVSVTGGPGPTAGRDAITVVAGLGPTAGRDVVILYPPGVPVAEPVAAARVQLLAASARLPADLSPLIGRHTELDDLRGFFTAGGQVGPRVAVLSGLPGVGKSALAVRLAHQLAGRFGRPPLYADLGGLGVGRRDPAEVLGNFLHALQGPDEAMPTGLEERADLYQSLLADERALVVLDNAADAGQIRRLLPEGRWCLAIATSRARLATLPGVRLVNLEVLPEPAAVELLGTLAGPERIAADRQAAREVVRACGGLPLAVRIAGARLRSRPVWTVGTLAEELADRRRRLGRLKVEDLDVRASFALSYDDLPEGVARTFRLLGLLAGPESTAGVAAALTGDDPAAAKDAMEGLVDAQLLEVVAPGRYRLHDLLYLFARERLEAEELEAVRRAALERVEGWSVKEPLAQDFEVKAEWREQMAAEWPDDATRNARAAEGLRGLAEYVRTLPDNDLRLRRLAWAWSSPHPDGGAAHLLLDRYGFGPGSHLGLPDHDSFLTSYTAEWSAGS